MMTADDKNLETTGQACVGADAAGPEEQEKYTFLQRQAMRMARWPKTHFWVAFAVSFVLSFVGMAFGDFSVSTEGGGWNSRGTLIADRHTQLLMVQQHEDDLLYGGEEAWEDLIQNVQPGWEEAEMADDNDDDVGRRLAAVETVSAASIGHTTGLSRALALSDKTKSALVGNSNNKALSNFLARRLQEDDSGAFDGCDTEWYTDGRMTNQTRLWPVWKVATIADTALEPETLKELCIAEEQTQRILEEKGLCFGCEGSATRKCLPPHSIVLYARMLVPDGLTLDCDSLATAWAPFQAVTEGQWKECVDFIETNPETTDGAILAEHCPDNFYSSLLDEFFDSTLSVQYTSSIFATEEDEVTELYEIVADFGRGGVHIEGAYDTQYEDFLGLLAEGAVGKDMLLATGSALITTIAILVHTRSPFLTLVGLVQIIMSFPLAFFVYRFIGVWNFFPFLNFIGVFVVFALGADHVFVAVDKWKNARFSHPEAATEEIAAKALPDAASAMFLTTSTTAIAFFGTAICPVAPVRLFAIFCGLLITFDYIMDVLLLFPCLCIYDGYRNQNCCCVTFSWCQRNRGNENDGTEIQGVTSFASSTDGEVQPVKTSLIRRILLAYYDFIYMFRWPLLALSVVAFVVCCYFASTLGLPLSSDVRLLKPSVEYEKSYTWRLNLLYEALEKQAGSQAFVVWGVTPADTGDQSDPASGSTLELDESFDPSTEAAQTYMKDFCGKFFDQDFATASVPDYQCPINRFEDWLLMQSNTTTSRDASYTSYCAGASSLPMPSENFHACFSAWSQQEHELFVLSRNGVVEIMYLPFNSRVRYDSPNKDLDTEWNLIENWIKQDQKDAPKEVSKGYFSSMDFWWYDTNMAMLRYVSQIPKLTCKIHSEASRRSHSSLSPPTTELPTARQASPSPLPELSFCYPPDLLS